MSVASAAPLFLFGAFAFVWMRAAAFGATPPLPVSTLFLGPYFLVESAARLGVALLQGRGIGTVPGTLLYEAWRLLKRTILK